MELVVLNIGLELGVISPTLFAMMVVMAVATTMATTPIVHALMLGRREMAAGTELSSVSWPNSERSAASDAPHLPHQQGPSLRSG
jgi:hypothetical protein